MGTSMEARKKGGPFLPKWQRVKSSHKALSGKLFQPDITSVINRYDQTLTDYDALLKEQEKLKGMIGDLMKANEEALGEIADFNSELAQLSAKMKSATSPNGAILNKYSGGGTVDLQSIKAELNSVVSTAEEYISKRKQLFTDIDGTAYGNLNKFKKVRDDFVSQAASAEAQIAKLESDADSAESAIMSAIDKFVDIADDADHPEIVKSLKGLKV